MPYDHSVFLVDVPFPQQAASGPPTKVALSRMRKAIFSKIPDAARVLFDSG